MGLRAAETGMPDILVLTPDASTDHRGEFFESFNAADFAAAVGSSWTFVQDNQTMSRQGVLRGLHYQLTRPQGKLVRVVSGMIFDVVVDLRRSSPAFGRWFGRTLSAESREQLWIPPGFAHGYLAQSPIVSVVYKTTEYWYPDDERVIAWNDPDLGIAWPTTDVILSDRDRAATGVNMAQLFV